MKKTTIILIIGVLVILGIIIGVASKKGDSSDMMSQDLSSATGFEAYIQNGGSYECAVTQNIETEGYSNSTDGHVYVHNGMIRGDYVIEAQGISLVASLIVRDGFVYSWNSLTGMGIRADAQTSDSETAADVSTSGTITWDAETIGQFDCLDWNPDLSEFEVPTDITFQTL